MNSQYQEEMWSFETAQFRIVWLVSPCYDLDLSWDTDTTIARQIEDGTLTAFDSEIAVVHKSTGTVLSGAFLGESIYANVADFRDHIGIRVKSRRDGRNYGSYFSGMVREAVADARKALASLCAANIHT